MVVYTDGSKKVNSGLPRRLSIQWDIRRQGRQWTSVEFDARLWHAPEKIEYVDGIFVSDRERMTVLGMLLENLGIDAAVQFGRTEDWEAAIAARRSRESGPESAATP